MKIFEFISFFLNIFASKFVYLYQFGAYNEALYLAQSYLTFNLISLKKKSFWLKLQIFSIVHVLRHVHVLSKPMHQKPFIQYSMSL